MRRLIFLVLALGLAAPMTAAAAPATQQANQQAAAEAAPATQLSPNVLPAAAKPADATRRFFALASFGAVTLIVLMFCWRSEVLRDSQPPGFVGRLGDWDTQAPIRATYRRCFSLAQTQMMWWFWIVLASYVYIAWKAWDVGGGLTDQALMLTGIGISTAVGSAIIDQSKKDKAGPLKDLSDAEAALRAAGLSEQQRTDQYNKLNDAAKRLKSDNFLADMLSDVNGVSMHRFQSLAWTVVLGSAFLVNVFYNDAMPKFDALQLSLLGISAGTYLGLKIPEQT